MHRILEAAGSPSTSVPVWDTSDIQTADTKLEWAAIRIQTAFRGFLV